jgi:hypothetical protein
MSRNICTQPCWHEGHLYRLGDEFFGNELPKNKKGVIIHFRVEGDETAGENIPNRSYDIPPELIPSMSTGRSPGRPKGR